MLRSAFWSALGVGGAGLLLGAVNYIWPRHVALAAGEWRIPPESLPSPGAPPFRVAEGKFWLVNLRPGEGVPASVQDYATPSEQGGFLALSQRCPHLGCTVPWNANFTHDGVKGWFRCPCHASTYTRAGIRVLGPAPRPMDTHPVRFLADGSAVIDTRRVLTGGPDNAERAIPLTR